MKFKIKAMSFRALFETLITSAVICRQRFLHESNIVKCLQSYKEQDVNQGHFRKPLQDPKKVMKNDYTKTAHTFFRERSIFSYFLRLN